MFQSPYVLLGLVLGAVCLSVFSFTGGVRYANGQAAQAKVTAQIAFNKRLAEANEELRTREQAYATTSAQLSAQYQQLRKEKDDATQKLSAAIRSGSKRVFVDAKCPTASPSPLPETGTDTSRPSSAGATQLDPGIAESLVAFGGKFDQLQLNYNRCFTELENDRNQP